MILKRVDNPISRNAVTSLAFHPTRPLIAYGYRDGKVALRDVINQKTKFLNEDMTDMPYVSGLSFSSNGNQLGSVTFYGKFLIWDTQTFQLLRGPEVLWSDYSNAPVDINLPMQKIASPFSYGVRVWDIAPSGTEGPRILPLPVPKRSGELLFSQGGESLSISKDGNRIAVVVENTGNIYLLDELDGHPLPTPIIMNSNPWLPTLAFDAAGRRLASVGGSDGYSAFILDVNPESWVSIACRIAN
ncbi:MAG: hypothetical protein IPI97_04775 [Nitrosomonas sp.]|nr:hypothetical protein [Nitrosomonas sp.]MBK7364327.1 hypothetical protein [Nitrosomonas sp.]